MQTRKYVGAIAFLCLVGLAATSYLTYLHLEMFTGSWEEPSLCGISRRISCEAVSASSYSALFGVPVAWIGGMFYLLVGALAVLGWLGKGRNAAAYAAVIFWLAGLAVVIDIYFAFVMVFLIKSLCLFCLMTYILNIIILVLAYKISPRSRVAMWEAASAHFSPKQKGAPAVLVCLLAVALIGGSGGMQIRKLEKDTLSRFDEASYLASRAKMPRLAVDTSADPAMGSERPILTIVEFSDFQCPHCRRAHMLMESLLPGYMDRVEFVFKNLPLGRDCNRQMLQFPDDLHPAACDLARLGEAAAEQGKFWQMHDTMFDRQGDLPAGRGLENNEMLALAQEAGLDMEKLQQSLSAEASRLAVEADVEAAIGLDIKSTPTFVINGLKIEGLPSLPVMKRLLDIELEEANKTRR